MRERRSPPDGNGRDGAGRPAVPGADPPVAAKRIETTSVGRGTYRVLSDEVVGGELTDGKGDPGDGERLVHLSAFPEGG